MSKRILLIDSDETFARSLKSALEGRGLAVLVASNSEQGMSLAKGEGPDLIVVCVEAQPTNGYMLCTRLKKDEQLKLVPVILTSANATPESFEKHKKLKTRAEEYLIKPFEPEALLHRIGSLLRIDIPPAAPAPDEEILAMDDEPLGLGDLVGEDEPVHLTDSEAAEAHAGIPPPLGDDVELDNVDVEEVLSDEEASPSDQHAGPQGMDEHAPASDEDLDLLDAAFDALSPASRPPPAPHDMTRAEMRSADGDEFDPAMLPGHADLLPVDDVDVVTEEAPHAEHAAQAEAVAALEARIHELEESVAIKDAELEAARKGSSASSATELRKLKEVRSKADKENVRLKEELNEKEKELIELRDQQAALEHQAQTLEDDGLKREIAAKALQQRAEALAAAAKKFERELGAAREELKSAAALKTRIAEFEKEGASFQELKNKHLSLEQELAKSKADTEGLAAQHKERATRLEAELSDARMQHENEREQLQGDADDLRGQLETHKASAERSSGALQAAAATHAEEVAQLARSHETAIAGAKAGHDEALARLGAEHGEALTAAGAELALAREAHEKAQAGLKDAREASEKAQSDLNEARAAAEKLTSELETSQLAGLQADDDIAAAKALAAKLKSELEQAQSGLAKITQDLSAAREETEKTQLELAGAQEQIDQAKSESAAGASEKALLSDERDRLRHQLEQANAAAQRNEQRAVEAYQRIKGDEKLREKTKKALQIALQLLDEVQALPEEDIAIDSVEIEQQQSA
jgi:CheY-like chemotaxis protein